MCGIFAYLNNGVPRDRRFILAVLIAGLKRLEYRGYDSAGLAIDGDNGTPSHPATVVLKRQGKVAELEKAIQASDLDLDRILLTHVGIAHTRWATHGVPNEVNCHPHLSDPTGEFTVVHNGIITNYKDLKLLLEGKGYMFASETDTECVAILVKYLYDTKLRTNEHFDFRSLVEDCVSQLEGAYALVFKSAHFPGQAVATRHGSPLLIGIRHAADEPGATRADIPIRFLAKAAPMIAKGAGPINPVTLTPELWAGGVAQADSWTHYNSSSRDVPAAAAASSGEAVEYFFASDASAVVEHTKRVVFLEDHDVAFVRDGALSVHRVHPASAGAAVARSVQTLEIELQEIMKGKFAHFMLKEIFEQPESVVNTMRGRVNFDTGVVHLGGMVVHLHTLQRARRLMFIACGTSYNSAIATRQFLEETTELPVIVDIASDFLDRQCPIFRDDVCFFISQSGETADTLNAMRYCRDKGALVVGITNTVGSSISRETHCGVHLNAGPEIGVASTKAYTSQILALVLLGVMLAGDRVSKRARCLEVIKALRVLPAQIRAVLATDNIIKDIAAQIYQERSLLVMGRGVNFANCLEGALKIKELTYLHSEGILAGELKHGPLALIDEHMPIIMILMRDQTFAKSQNALQQIVARQGRPIIICQDGDTPSAGAGTALRTIPVPPTVDCLQSILTVVPLQLLAYHIATMRGLDVDCPRNLAKSVTVE